MGRVIMGAKKACCQQNLRKFSEAIKLGDTGRQHDKEWGFFNLSNAGMSPNSS